MNTTFDEPSAFSVEDRAMFRNARAIQNQVSADAGMGVSAPDETDPDLAMFRQARAIAKRRENEKAFAAPKTPPQQRVDAGIQASRARGQEAAQAVQSAKQAAATSLSPEDLARRVVQFQTRFNGDPKKVSDALAREGWDKSLITPKFLAALDNEIGQMQQGVQQMLAAPQPGQPQDHEGVPEQAQMMAAQAMGTIQSLQALKAQLIREKDGNALQAKTPPKDIDPTPPDKPILQTLAPSIQAQQMAMMAGASRGIVNKPKAEPGASQGYRDAIRAFVTPVDITTPEGFKATGGGSTMGALPDEGFFSGIGTGLRQGWKESAPALLGGNRDLAHRMDTGTGVGAWLGRTGASLVGGLINPEQLPANVLGYLTGAKAAQIAEPVLGPVAKVAGNKAAAMLEHAIGGAAGMAPISGIQATSQAAESGKLAEDPMGAAGDILKATGGGAAFGAGLGVVSGSAGKYTPREGPAATVPELMGGRTSAEPASLTPEAAATQTAALEAFRPAPGPAFEVPGRLADLTWHLIDTKLDPAQVSRQVHSDLIEQGMAPAEARAVASAAATVHLATEEAIKADPQVRDVLDHSPNPEQARAVLAVTAEAEVAQRMAESPTETAATASPREETPPQVKAPLPEESQQAGSEVGGIGPQDSKGTAAIRNVRESHDANDLKGAFLRIRERGTPRIGNLDAALGKDGLVHVGHAVSGRDLGTIDLDTGKKIPSRPKDAAALDQVETFIREQAFEQAKQMELDRLRNYPARNADAIAALNPKRAEGESNPRPADLESAALPTELLTQASDGTKPIGQSIADSFLEWSKKHDMEAIDRAETVKKSDEAAAKAADTRAVTGKPLTRQQIEKTLIEKHEAIAGPREMTDAEQSAAGTDSIGRVFYHPDAPSLGDKVTPAQLHRMLPGEVRDQFTPQEAADAGFQVTNQRGKATGEDSANAIGWDRYLSEAQSGSVSARVSAAKDFLRDFPDDPEGRFLSALHDSIPSNGRLRGVQSVSPSKLKVGDTFTVNGIDVRVEDAGNGEQSYLVLKDGNDLPTTPLEAMEKVPVDKGSLNGTGAKSEAAGKPIPESPSSGEVPAGHDEVSSPRSSDEVQRPPPPESDAAGDGPNAGGSPDRTIGLNKSEQDRIRSETGLSELPEHEVRGWEEVLNKAKESGDSERALEVAAEIKQTNRPMTDQEHAAAVVKAAELSNRYEEAVGDAAKAIDAGRPEEAGIARARAQAILEQIDLLTEATRNSRRETARALSIGRMMVNRESMDLAAVMTRAKEAKGSPLSAEQTAQLESLTRLYKIQAEKLAEAEKLIQKQKAEAEKLRAGQMVRRAAARSEARAKSEVKHQRLKIERNAILEDLRKIGVRTNEVVGASAEALYHVGRLAVNIMKEGAVSLEDVVQKVREHVPDITDEEVYRAINTKDPARQSKARTETQKRVADLKKQAGLLLTFDERMAKVAAEKAAKEAKAQQQAADKAARAEEKRKARAEVGQVQMVLTQLRMGAYKTLQESSRLERAVRTVNELQDLLANHARALKEGKPEVPAEVAALREKAQELRRVMRTEDTLTDLQHQLETGDFKHTVTPFVEPISPEVERMQIAVKRARRDIRMAIEEMRPKTKLQRVESGLNFLRTMKATADVSYALRQGAALSARRPGLAAKTFGQAFQTLFSEHKAEQIDNAIRSSPNQFLRDRAGLYLAELGKGPIKGREEAFMSNLAERIPVFGKVVAASERNMVTGLNLLRAGAFDEFVEKHPNATRAELEAWADYVNKASGRGTMGPFAEASRAMAAVIFAPRFTVSRFQTPLTLLKNMDKPRVRTEIAKDLAAFYGTGIAALSLAALAGAKVGTNPREPDFGKIVIGDTHIDIWAGFQQPARLIAGAIANVSDRTGLTKPEFHADQVQAEQYSPLEAAARFASYKLAPSASVPLELWTGRDVTGQPTSVTKTLATAAVPLLLTDTAQAYEQGGVGPAAIAAIGSGTGLGVSTYPPSEAQIRKQYLRMKRDGDAAGAEALRSKWNAEHKDNQISPRFTGEPKPVLSK